MNKPSERIVVFVTPAQKRAITSTAEGLGISVSELMRRAVLSFGATSEQVKAASIVDRLRAPREPDALNEALRKAARGTRHTHPAEPAPLPAGLVRVQPAPAALPHTATQPDHAHGPSRVEPMPFEAAGTFADDLPADSPPFDPATATEEEMRNAAEAVARVAAAKAASLAAHPADATVVRRPRPRIDHEPDADSDPHGDPATDGRFA
ncbi:hypothetical protein [Paraburkholderia saeva]|uniref:Uncharacterized protein n=1 Tax=Paraburkholderia saeva TaxID=2777537 RepID=A0A9N8S1H2_9BURK|nr:hypothetical protein [Paraburkholderia saeva]CAG4891762.1 hypothetical protein R70241_01186 [Paraburkholderia saeva]CAG4896429.1 hypothetical protein R52603_02189 [Paraburkholderia saeva]CAG4920910.1 hypothetical protein LMG31841_05033 [Paraburkholderia saeva]